MRIVSDLDSGNVIVREERLAIRHDSGAPDFRQWFHFAVEGATSITLDVSDTTYPTAWEDYDVCTSLDLDTWFRTPTTFDGESLQWEVPEAARVYYAYFAPYGRSRHVELIRELRRSPFAKVRSLGKSVRGRTMDLVTIGDGERMVWVTARQHPGETMAEWYAEGLLARLVDESDDIARAVRESCTIHVVPNMNPDGSVLGNQRANAVGMNLNRAWLEPDRKESPEVLAVRAMMEKTGVDLFLDVHGDEQNPWCFLAGCEGNPSYDDRIRDLENLFEQALLEGNDDFQDEYGYDRDEPGGGDLRTAGNWVGERFQCLSFTVEMPYKDAANHPDPEYGFDPVRAKRLGASTLEAILASAPELR
jgi:murein tripeptide amidase MpaA